jgi:hypothetical protein
MKVMALIFLVIFAATATTIVAELSSSQIAKKNVDFTKSYSIVQIDDNGTGPTGIAIDDPEMPG